MVTAALFLIISHKSAAQGPSSEADRKKEAQKYFEAEDFESAYPLYAELLSLHPDNPDYNYRLGTCMLLSKADKEKPVDYLEMATKDPSIDKLAFFYLARAYHLNYRFDDAIKTYKQFEQIAPSSQSKKHPVFRLIEQCENGKTLLKDVHDLDVLVKKELSLSDYYHAYDLSANGGSTLIEPDDFKSKLDKKQVFNSVIYLSSDKNEVFFSSYGDDYSNGKDIYEVKRLPTGGFSKPTNLGTIINTPYDEDFPFYDAPTHTLYFSSMGHNSMGGYDVFKSVRNDATGTWSTPVNMDFPINTPDDDILFIADTLNQTAYFASTRSSPKGTIDIYKIKVQQHAPENVLMKGIAFTDMGRTPAASTITVKYYETNKAVGVYNSSHDDGSFFMSLPNGQQLVYTVETPGHTTQTAPVLIPKEQELTTLKQEIGYDSATDKLIITNHFETTGGISNEYLLALDYIKKQAQLDVNIDSTAPIVNPNNNAVTQNATQPDNNTNSANTNPANNNQVAQNNNSSNPNNTNPSNNNQVTQNNTSNPNNTTQPNNNTNSTNNTNTANNNQVAQNNSSNLNNTTQPDNNTNAANNTQVAQNNTSNPNNTTQPDNNTNAANNTQVAQNNTSNPNNSTQPDNNTNAANNNTSSPVDNTSTTQLVKIADSDANQQEQDAKASKEDADRATQYANDKMQEAQNLNNEVQDIAAKANNITDPSAKNDSLAKAASLKAEADELTKKATEAYQIAAQEQTDAQTKEKRATLAKKYSASLDSASKTTNNKDAIAQLQTQQNNLKKQESSDPVTPVTAGDLIRQEAQNTKHDSVEVAQKTDKLKKEIDGLQQQSQDYIDQAQKTDNAQEKVALLQQAKDLSESKKAKQKEIEDNQKLEQQLHTQYVEQNAQAKTTDSISKNAAQEGSPLVSTTDVATIKNDIAHYTPTANHNNPTNNNQVAQNNNSTNPNNTTQPDNNTNSANNSNPANNNQVAQNNNSSNPNNTTQPYNNTNSANNATSANNNQVVQNNNSNNPNNTTQPNNNTNSANSANSANNNQVAQNNNSNNPNNTTQPDNNTNSANNSNPTNNNQVTQNNNSSNSNNTAQPNNNTNSANSTNTANNNQVAQNNNTSNSNNTAQPNNNTNSANSTNTANNNQVAQNNANNTTNPNSQQAVQYNNTTSGIQNVISTSNIQYTNPTASQANQTATAFMKDADTLTSQANNDRQEATHATNPTQARLLSHRADSLDDLAQQKRLQSSETANTANSNQFIANKQQLAVWQNVEQNDYSDKLTTAKLLNQDANFYYNKSLIAKQKADSADKPYLKQGYLDDAAKFLSTALLKQQQAQDIYLNVKPSLASVTASNTPLVASNNNSSSIDNNPNNSANNTNPVNNNQVVQNNNSTNPNNNTQPDNNTNSANNINPANNNQVAQNNNTSNPNNTAQPNNSTNSANNTNPVNNNQVAQNNNSNNPNNNTQPDNNTNSANNTNPANNNQVAQNNNSNNPNNNTQPDNNTNSANNATSANNNQVAQYNNSTNPNNNTQPDNNTNSANNATSANNNQVAQNNNAQPDNNTNSANNTNPANNNQVAQNNNTSNLNNTTQPDNNTNSANNTNPANNNQVAQNNNTSNPNNSTQPDNNTNSAQNNTANNSVAIQNANKIDSALSSPNTHIDPNALHLNATENNNTAANNNNPTNNNQVAQNNNNSNPNNTTQPDNNTNSANNAATNNNLVAQNNSNNANNSTQPDNNTNSANNTTNNNNAATNNNLVAQNNSNNANNSTQPDNNTNSANNTANNNNTTNSNNRNSITLSAEDVFTELPSSPYSATKPIPINQPLPEGLVFKVQIGAFRNAIRQNLFKGIDPITGEKTATGLTKYMAGIFKEYNVAKNAQDKIHGIGFKDAFVVAFLNGKQIPLYKAIAILNGNTNTTQTAVANTPPQNNVTQPANNATQPDNNTNTTQSANNNVTNVQQPQTNNNNIIVSTPVADIKGLFFSVQVGAFQHPVPPAKLYNLSPLYSYNAPNGYLRYNCGTYSSLPKATIAKQDIIARTPIKDAFVVAYSNGQRIGLAQANQLLSSGGVNVSQTPNLDALPNGIQAPDNTQAPQTNNNTTQPSNTPPITPVNIQPAVKDTTASANTLANKGPVTVSNSFASRTLSSGNVAPADDIKVSVTIHRGAISGFAKLEETIPPGFTAAEGDKQGATYNFEDGKLQYVWSNLPTDSVFTVTYELTALSTASGQQTVTGKFLYLVNSEKQEMALATSTLNVVASSRVAPPVNNTPAITDTTGNSKVVFCVQVGAYSGTIPIDMANKLLQISSGGIKAHKDDSGITSYTVGSYPDYKTADQMKKELIQDGYDQSFIVAYYQGKKISLKQAQLLNNK